MLKPSKNPYGFQNLLAYKKAEELQAECRKITRQFPKTKTMIDLADQMDRSARSGKQNIVEGWKRNTTKEYFDFLGFSIGAVAELEEDCNDIWKGRYSELEGIKGVMREKGLRGGRGSGMGSEMGRMEEKGGMGNYDSFTNSSNSFNPTNPTNPSNPTNPTHPSYPINPFNPINSHFDIDKLPFYPLDTTLPPIVQLKLRAKELNYLLHRLQVSLETKMQNEKTLPVSAMARAQLQKIKEGGNAMDEFLKQSGFRRLSNGQMVKIKTTFR